MSDRPPSPSSPSAPAFSVGEPGAGVPRSAVAADARYGVGNLIGQGGMGEVRVAQDRLLGRDVAIKLLSPRLAGSDAAVHRLEREARVTAGLDHPGIVAVHDAGRLADGRPFYAMRLVRGRSLVDAIADARSDADRARLLRHLLAACEALAFAHRAGVVHRDLKPDNILVGSFGETQVVDWGLARRLTDPADVASLEPDRAEPGLTRAGTVLGTPWWMSPEQARGERADARSDVWGLGAILHAILTGDPPYGRGDPDAVLAALRRGPPAASRAGPPELRAIAARALAWDPAGRYADAGALAADLARWFDGERVAAYAYTSVDLARRLIAAWRVPLAVAAVGAVVLAATISLGIARTRAERDRALFAEAEARAAERSANAAFAEALVTRAVGLAQAGARADAELAAVEALSRVDTPEARGGVLAGFGGSARPRRLDAMDPTPCAWGAAADAVALCGWREGVQLRDAGGVVWARPLVGRLGAVGGAGALVVSDDGVYRLDRDTGLAGATWRRPGVRGVAVGDRYAIAADFGFAWVFDASVGEAVVHELCDGGVAAVAAPTGTWVLCRDGRWIGPNRARKTAFFGDTEVSAVAGLPSGELVLGTIRGRLAVMDAEGRARLEIASPLALVRQIRVAPDGHHVALLDAAGRVGLWDAATGDWGSMLPDRSARSLDFVGDVLEVTAATGVERWALPVATAPNRFWQPEGLSAVQISPDGTLVAYGGGGGGVTVRDLRDGRVVGRFTRVRGVAKALAFSPDGERLAITGQLGEPLVVEALVAGLAPWPVHEPIFVSRLTWTAEGLCGPTFGSRIHCWGPQRSIWVGSRTGDFSPGAPGDRVVGFVGAGEVWDGFDPGRVWVTVPNALAVDRHRGTLAVAVDEAVEIYDVSGVWVRSLKARGGTLRDVAFAPDGARIAAGGIDGRVYVWRVADGVLLGVLAGHTDRVAQVDWDPAGERLVSASWDGSVRIWDTVALEAPVGALIAAVREAWGAPPRD